MRGRLFVALATLLLLSVSVHADQPAIQLAAATLSLQRSLPTVAVRPVVSISGSGDRLAVDGALQPIRDDRAGGQPPPRPELANEADEPLPAGLERDLDISGLPLMPVAPGGRSYGSPNRGRLRHAVAMPDNRSLYMVRRPEYAFGSTHTVFHLQLALAKFRRNSGYLGPIVISDISRRRGGRYGPHRSHQSGRDVDLWLPLRSDDAGITVRGGRAADFERPDFEHFSAARPREIDWQASWGLVKALVRTGQVKYIFLSRSRQRRLYRAALRDGFGREALVDLIQFPKRKRTAIVRHARRHDKHMHIRFRCGPEDRRCR